jgi:SPP1 gp7 family putative phage head morphogenesis protein
MRRSAPVRRRRNPAAARAVHPNAGIGAAYARKLRALVAEMANSYDYWLRASYRANPPLMALDRLPADEMRRRLQAMGIRWQEKFATAAPKLAAFFAQSTAAQNERVLLRILRDAGVTVRLTMTPELRDIMKATVSENVSLIKSIHSQYHTQIEGIVMRSVTEGRDLQYLSKELRARYGVSKERANFIALDQNNKATSVIQRERQTSVGIERGIWMHSHAGREPRPTHLANDGREFDLKTGWFDPDPKVRKHIWPGVLIRCRCTWKPIVKGFS